MTTCVLNEDNTDETDHERDGSSGYVYDDNFNNNADDRSD